MAKSAVKSKKQDNKVEIRKLRKIALKATDYATEMVSHHATIWSNAELALIACGAERSFDNMRLMLEVVQRTHEKEVPKLKL